MKKIVALALCLIMALSLATVAFAAVDETGLVGKYLLSTGTKDVTLAKEITSASFVKAVTCTCEAGKTGKAFGVTAHYVVNGGACVQVASLAEADYVVYNSAECKTVLMYLANILADGKYYVGTTFTNFGKSCGQVNVDYDKTVTYYSFYNENGEAFIAAANDTAPDFNLKVGDKMIPVTYSEMSAAVSHNAIPVVADGKITGYKCATCGLAAVKAANVASIPADVMVIEGTTYYFPASAAAAAGVSSAKTFDAGVALYAGMALMSVAGSAVVIGKKKEF